MKFLRAVLYLSLTLSARADLTIVQNVEGAGPMSTITIKLKGSKARMEMGRDITTIIDTKSGEMLNLMNDQKKVIRISAEGAKAAAAVALKAEANAPRPQLKPTGRKEKILGYEAEEYVCDAPAFKATYWLSNSYPDAKSIMAQLQSLTPESWNIVGKGMPDYRDFPGLPLRSTVDMGGKQVTSTLASVKQDPLSDADFTVPKDFEEMKMPNMGGLFGGEKSPSPRK